MADKATWVIVAGGKGTRSKDPSIPKILQRVGPTDILGLLLESLPGHEALDLVFVLKQGADLVQYELSRRAREFPNVTFRVLHDAGAGPVAALKTVATLPTNQTLAVVLGDTAISAPLGDYLERYFEMFAGGPAMTVRQSDHLYDSNAVALDWQGCGVRHFSKGEDIDSSAGTIWGMSGLMFVPRVQLDQLDEQQGDIATAILKSSPLKEIGFLPISHFFRDSGTPERLESITAQLEANSPDKRTAAGHLRPALFVDRDGTLVPDVSSGRTRVAASEVNLSVVEQIRNANEVGMPVFLCTNQPAIAKGFVTMEQTHKVHNDLQAILRSFGARIDDFLVCPHHPEAGHAGEVEQFKVACDCRKPGIGMLVRAQRLHGIALNESSFLLGDSDVDRQTADNARIQFRSVDSL
jgi:histidinol-phosphate phosphatase family protein